MEEKKLKDEISYENRLNVPESEKKKGDEYLRSNDLEEAIRSYSKAIMAVKILYDDKAINEAELKKMVLEIGIPSNLNISYCYLKLKEWQKVVDHTTRVIEFDRKHVKALYRRCLAYIEVKKFEKADDDLIVLEELIGGTKELEDLESKFESKKKEIIDNEAVIYKKMFRKYMDNSVIVESVKRKNRCKNFITKTPAAIKSLTYYFVDLYVVKPAKYVLSKSSYLKKILFDDTFDYVKTKFIRKKNE